MNMIARLRVLFLTVMLLLPLGVVSVMGQSVTIVKELKQVPMSSALAMYKNEFGKYEKPKLDNTFPFAVIRMYLEGNAQAVKLAKERFTLDMGQHTGVEARVTTYSNQILFLVPARRPYIYIDCGDGCDQVLLSNMQQLQSNCVYDCTVRFTPERDGSEVVEVVDKDALLEELRAELANMMQEQKANQQETTAVEEQPSDTIDIEVEEAVVEDTLSNYQRYVQNAKMKTLVMGQLGYAVSPQLSYGAMIGQMYNGYGWYVSARSNFQFGHGAIGVSDAAGLVDGVKPFYSGSTSSSYLAIHGGFMMNVLEKVAKNKFNTLGVYVGGGYGKRELLAETTNGEWIKYAPTSYNGFGGNVGLFGSVAGVTLNVGVSTINFKYVELEVGVGFMF